VCIGCGYSLVGGILRPGTIAKSMTNFINIKCTSICLCHDDCFIKLIRKSAKVQNIISNTQHSHVNVVGRLKMQGWKMPDWKMWDQHWRVENAGLENAGPKCKGGKCETGKCGTEMQGWKMRDWKMRDQNVRVENAGLENARKDSVWKTQCMEHRALFSSAQSCSAYWVELNEPTCESTTSYDSKSNNETCSYAPSKHVFLGSTTALTHACSSCAPWVTVWAHALFSTMLQVTRTQRTTTATNSATTATTTISRSQPSVHLSRKTCVKCVWCSDATQD